MARLYTCFLLACLNFLSFRASHGLSTTALATWKKDIATGWRQRVEADPSFLKKSVVEVLVAGGTEFTAQWQSRGVNLLPEIDFVIAGVLTAITGKYYSMWRVAKTKTVNDSGGKSSQKREDPHFLNLAVPTNAFQSTMLDGITRPSLSQRLGAIFAPMNALFKAGFLSSAFGYGLTSLMILIRTFLMPSYVAATRQVNIIYASLYTGVYLATSSNIRYQVLQGLIEPTLDSYLQRVPALRNALLFLIRLGNGMIGSILAIYGMKVLGLQRLK